jgi:hypothetical protein
MGKISDFLVKHNSWLVPASFIGLVSIGSFGYNSAKDYISNRQERYRSDLIRKVNTYIDSDMDGKISFDEIEVFYSEIGKSDVEFPIKEPTNSELESFISIYEGKDL